MRPGSESTATVIPLGPAFRVASDSRLARLAAAGNRAAFAAIFDRYHQELYRYCVSLLRNQDDAADALQSTMLHALRALEGDDRDIALRPWLYRIAHNESVSLLRRRPRTEAEVDTGLAAVVDVEASAAMRARLQTLLDDIRSLPERQRAAIVMRELAGLSYDEIAAALVTSPAGAKQAVYDARRALLDLSKGRDETCDSIQLRISSGDRRVARARSVRAHLRACTDCRMFALQISEREQALAGLAPVLPAAVAAHVLKGALVGAGGTSAEGVLFGVSTTVIGNAAATVAVTIAVGAGVAGLDLADRGDAREPAPRPPAVGAPPPGTASAGSPAASRTGRGTSSSRADSRSAGRGASAERGGGAGRAERDERTGRTRPGAPAKDVDQGAATVAAPVGAATPERRSGRLGLRRPGRSGAGPGQRGPIRTAVGGVRDSVGGTVGDVRDHLPVSTPRVPLVEKPGG